MNKALVSGINLGVTGAEPLLRAEPASVVSLQRLSLTEFRNYAAAVVEVDPRPVVLTGPNGAGKTNLLEAISLLGPGRGLRRARLGEIAREAGYWAGQEMSLAAEETAKASGWAVAAQVMTGLGLRDVGTGAAPSSPRPAEAQDEVAGRERRVVKIDGAMARSQQALGEILGVVWLTPQMDGLFRDGAAARRRFLDRLVYSIDPGHAGRVSAYEQALRERARLLKSGTGDDAWLAALEETMAGQAVAIAAARRALVSRLAEICAAADGPFPRPELVLSGDVEAWLDKMPALAAEEALIETLTAGRVQDAASGGASAGPHRSDLVVRHLGKGLPAAFCSTGEQKALLVAIVLAHARLVALDRAAPPLLLLDEVAAHLDAERREALFAEVLAMGTQAWFTGTDPGLFSGLGTAVQFFAVRDARIRPAEPPGRAE